MAPSRLLRVYVIALAACLLAFVLALRLGAVADLDAQTVAELRLPRTLLAMAVGAGLSVAGAALQALFANPLCEPYTLGISSGSALGAVLGMGLGLNLAFSGLAGSAFIGALLFAGALYLIARRPGTGNTTVLLVGVMLGFLGSSLVTVWVALSDTNGLGGAMVWLWGDLSRARLQGAFVALGGVFLASVLIWTRWRELDALLMGEEGALSLGVDVSRIRRHLILLTSLLIGLCVSAAGMIGFVGLIVPHFSRKLVGSLHRELIPLCAIWGATALMLADTLARVATRPYELPVGVVTALVGAPAFLWIMLKSGDAGEVAWAPLNEEARAPNAVRLAVSGLTLEHGGRRILDEVSFELAPGEILALLGPNGSGKSTLLKAVAGITPVGRVTGSLRFQGQELAQLTLAERARRVTYLGADLIAQFPMTAAQAVQLGRSSQGAGLLASARKSDLAAVEQAMRDCRCWELRARDLHSLSGGERQLVGLARALVQGARVLFLDESLSRMDLHHQAAVGALLTELARKGYSVILVSHDINIASEWAHTALLLQAGKALACGPIRETLTEQAVRTLYPGAQLTVGVSPASGAPKVFFARSQPA